MNKKTKKGFTLVELLVVIAILAILATVSVVGYTSFIDKANQSVDEQAVTQMNLLLQADEIASNPPTSVTEVKTLLTANGYNGKFEALHSKYALGWLSTENIMVLVQKDSNSITYPEAYTSNSVSDVQLFNVKFANSAADLVDQLTAIGTGVAEFSSIVINSDMTLSNTNEIVINEGNAVELDLNGKTITTSNLTYDKIALTADGKGELTITNGTITTAATVAFAESTSKLTLVNTTLVTTGSTYAVGTNGGLSVDSEVYIDNCVITGSYGIFAPSGKWIIKNSTITGRNCISGNNITIENCNFVGTGSGIANNTWEYRTNTTNVAAYLNGTNKSAQGDGTSGCVTFGDSLLIIVNRKEDSYKTENITIKDCKFSFAGDTAENNKAYGLRVLDLGNGSIDAHAVVHLEGNTYENYTGCPLGDVAVFQSVPTGATEAFN